MTRVQKERFFNEDDYVRMKDFYILDAKKDGTCTKGYACVHPLPRVNEISVEVDKDPRAAYFKQVQYGRVCTYGTHTHFAGDQSFIIIINHREKGNISW